MSAPCAPALGDLLRQHHTSPIYKYPLSVRRIGLACVCALVALAPRLASAQMSVSEPASIVIDLRPVASGQEPEVVAEYMVRVSTPACPPTDAGSCATSVFFAADFPTLLAYSHHRELFAEWDSEPLTFDAAPWVGSTTDSQTRRGTAHYQWGASAGDHTLRLVAGQLTEYRSEHNGAARSGAWRWPRGSSIPVREQLVAGQAIAALVCAAGEAGARVEVLAPRGWEILDAPEREPVLADACLASSDGAPEFDVWFAPLVPVPWTFWLWNALALGALLALSCLIALTLRTALSLAQARRRRYHLAVPLPFALALLRRRVPRPSRAGHDRGARVSLAIARLDRARAPS